MNSLWARASAKNEPPELSAEADAADAAMPPLADAADITDVADTGVTAGPSSSLPSESAPVPPVPDPPHAPARPQLLHHQQPAPPSDLGPLALASNELYPQQPQATDSLSLQQLRNIVANFRRGGAVAYDFAYGDMGPLEEEIDEWFSHHQDRQWCRLHLAQLGFEDKWPEETSWEDAHRTAKEEFLQSAVAAMQSQDPGYKEASVGSILYVVLGVWAENASAQMNATATKANRSVATEWQLEAIEDGVGLLASVGGVPVVWQALVGVFERFWSEELQERSPSELQALDDELNTLMTIVYVTLQAVLNTESADLPVARDALLSLSPSLDIFMLNAASMLRWEENETMPATQLHLLLWKSLLLVFGDSEDMGKAKIATGEPGTQGESRDMITASPIDYHVFRQEIISKYPAYVPPKPVIPLEAENCSLLPPLPNQPPRISGGGVIPLPPNLQAGASILHQPVHIATPAPSPPPSPGIGKGSKKQNYQTNQNFPFMYPPLDATSNSAGGKGGAGLQEILVGRRWEGSDVPASILEAGRLFSERVRMTRATRQLWEEREKFIRFERGWEAEEGEDIEDLCLDELTPEEREEIRALKLSSRDDKTKGSEKNTDYGPQANLAPDIKRRLDAVEHFYHEALPQLQSLVIVLLKVILANIAMLSQGHHPGAAPRQNGPGMNGAPAAPANKPQEKNGALNGQAENSEMTPEELSLYRNKEIGAKAVAGILLLLLKWFKISRQFDVLKFEYLTQLLVDSNYLPLVLKLLAHADAPQMVGTKIDRTETSFFYFCNAASRNTRPVPAHALPREEDVPESVIASSSAVSSDGDGEAAPPPIKRQKSPQTTQDAQANPADSSETGTSTAPPEVDELGYPVNEIPRKPITDFSRRNFFTLINYLRVMQKCCKNKAHRNLLLVSYKSANILRKSLKVPQEDLRLYTLKLFKNQVPYCGRKWRQSNMRVITAVYLHCRPELRDEWLAGSDVDAEVDAALPLEQALRSLTHWFNVRRYPEKVRPKVKTAVREEQDFFTRELEKIHMTWPDGPDDSESSEWDHDGAGW